MMVLGGIDESFFFLPSLRPLDSFSYLDHGFKLVHAEAQLGHAGLKELPEPVVLHQLDKDTEGLLLRHLMDRGKKR